MADTPQVLIIGMGVALIIGGEAASISLDLHCSISRQVQRGKE